MDGFLGQNESRGKHDTLLTKNIINYPSHTFNFTYLEIFFTSRYFAFSVKLFSLFENIKEIKDCSQSAIYNCAPDQLGKVKGANAFTKYRNGHTEGDALNPQSQIIISSGDG